MDLSFHLSDASVQRVKSRPEKHIAAMHMKKINSAIMPRRALRWGVGKLVREWLQWVDRKEKGGWGYEQDDNVVGYEEEREPGRRDPSHQPSRLSELKF